MVFYNKLNPNEGPKSRIIREYNKCKHLILHIEK